MCHIDLDLGVQFQSVFLLTLSLTMWVEDLELMMAGGQRWTKKMAPQLQARQGVLAFKKYDYYYYETEYVFQKPAECAWKLNYCGSEHTCGLHALL